MFSAWQVDVGTPPNWGVDPLTGAPWSTTDFRNAAQDVKMVWELARFPYAYDLARLAVLEGSRTPADQLRRDVKDFQSRNPVGRGVHWLSGQEAAIRLVTLWFADTVLTDVGREPCLGLALSRLAADTARYIEENIDYAKFAVYNNHLLWEALGLYAAGACLTKGERCESWRLDGRALLVQQALRQFYPDGGYIQQSHNYHRAALEALLWACLIARTAGDDPHPEWHAAMRRSVDFLATQQNDADGALPNFGANDGALPSILSECDYSDFRPVLQAAGIESGLGKIYGSGPWDEEALWFCGAKALRDASQRLESPKSRSFPVSGMHVIRRGAGTFAAFRCGSLRDRFSQIDMLHLDVWWRGHNVIGDPGTYRYNAASTWHEHFTRTASHSTVQIDGRDQMVHFRQFKYLYLTEARILQFECHALWSVMAGEHYGYRRFAGACVHRRSVLSVGEDLWVVVDSVLGTGRHRLRLHWLGGPYAWGKAPDANGMDLRTPQGVFTVRTFDVQGLPLAGDVVAGDEEAPRGWLSRYYGEKVPVASFVTIRHGAVPLASVSVLSGAAYDLSVEGDRWSLMTPSRDIAFTISDGTFGSIELTS